MGVIFVGNTVCYFGALQTIPASTASLIFYAYPVIVTLLAAALGMDRLTVRSVGPARAAVVSSLEVLVTIGLAAAFLHERIGRQWVGEPSSWAGCSCRTSAPCAGWAGGPFLHAPALRYDGRPH